MNKIQIVTKFDFLPNEILIECFEYLNGVDIVYAFDCLNYRLNKLILSIPLYVNFEHIPRAIFDKFCTKIKTNPEMKQHIYSLGLSDETICVPIDSFTSIFSLNEFSHLRSLILMTCLTDIYARLKPILSSLSELQCFRLIHLDERWSLKLDSPISTLETLSVPTSDYYLTSIPYLSSVINLTISDCYLHMIHHILQEAVMLKYLTIEQFFASDDETCGYEYASNSSAFHLIELIIRKRDDCFEDFETLFKRTPNLRRLAISNKYYRKRIDPLQWEHLITSSLSCLVNFKFNFVWRLLGQRNLIEFNLEQFQSDFWQKKHQWFTEYVLDNDTATIYTTPYMENTYELNSSSQRYCNRLVENTSVFDNVTDLFITDEAITKISHYYFPGVTSLTLKYGKIDIEDPLRCKRYIESLEMIVNLSRLKHLDISSGKSVEFPPSILSEIFKQAPLLSSMKIYPGGFSSWIDHEQLCKDVNQRIKKVDMFNDSCLSFDAGDDIRQFCHLFANVEQLICCTNQTNQLLFLLKHLTKCLYLVLFGLLFKQSEQCSTWLIENFSELDVRFLAKSHKVYRQKLYLWIKREAV